MQVQLDLDYRKEWDKMSMDLYIVESEPLTHSDLIYWELRWPVIIYIHLNLQTFLCFYLIDYT